jgi:polar amino acid transport system ATP-binding protein
MRAAVGGPAQVDGQGDGRRPGRDPVLSVEELRKSFDGTYVLNGVSFVVDSSEVVFVVGPSGSGKSTLLRCLNRLEEPTSGTVRLDGAAITGPSVDLPKMRQSIGFVFQAFNLYPHLSALGNVTLALRWVKRLSRKEANERGLAALAEVGLADKVLAHPAQLSGGQQQRVAIARALVLEPKVMLLDEPTSALDPELVGEVLATLGNLRRQRMTMVIVSHEMQFAREAADRVIFMDQGQIVESAPPQELLARPRQARTREFLARYLGQRDRE